MTTPSDPGPSSGSARDLRAARIQQLSAIEYPADLPVVARREELAQAIEKHQVVIVCGETGSGKTTQLPKICLGWGAACWASSRTPSRAAWRRARWRARIAHELKTELGGLVGYKMRFNDKVSPDTCIKLMTDGILLAEIQHDPLLQKLRHHHHRRGARALAQHRFSAGLSQAAAAAPSRSEAHHHLGDAGCGALLPAFRGGRIAIRPYGYPDRRGVWQYARSRPHHPGLRPHLPGRSALPPAAAERRRRYAGRAAGDMQRAG